LGSGFGRNLASWGVSLPNRSGREGRSIYILIMYFIKIEGRRDRFSILKGKKGDHSVKISVGELFSKHPGPDSRKKRNWNG
jgi:hypothetical protein